MSFHDLFWAKGLGKFVRYSEGSFYIEHLHLTNFMENYWNVLYIEVQLIINLQSPAFPEGSVGTEKLPE